MRAICVAASLGLAMTIGLGWPVGTAGAEPATFDSAEAAVEALVGALEAGGGPALLDVFGPESADVMLTGDEGRDRQIASDLLASYRAAHVLVPGEDGSLTLSVGFERWPFPVPLVATGAGAWRFDVDAGREELRVRTIGENELAVIDLLRRYVQVQAAYRQVDYDGDGVMEYADAILSDPGSRNGLYWPSGPGLPDSPVGDLMARASADGYASGAVVNPPEPYLGYLYRVLTRQGLAAPGGARDYRVDGHMVSGHALLAFPADYGESGIMSFLVGEDGIVYEADLGPDTLAIAGAISSYDPDERWTASGE